MYYVYRNNGNIIQRISGEGWAKKTYAEGTACLGEMKRNNKNMSRRNLFLLFVFFFSLLSRCFCFYTRAHCFFCLTLGGRAYLVICLSLYLSIFEVGRYGQKPKRSLFIYIF
ncbi:hypothetical protein F4810DRAFT_596593 [Camillea tinctor]|nr:hypothetical protein F4810DRAFT_596593 [Camillea tinctor]